MVRKLFGTDGIRGKVNIPPMTPEIILKLGKAAAIVLTKHNKNEVPKVIIGKDTRKSGYIFEDALTSGLCSMGVDVYLVGPLPTPAIAYITKSFPADAGIVISASHNPAGDNGIKFFDKDGFKLPDKIEEEIEDIMHNRLEKSNISVDNIGKAYRIDDARDRYINLCKNTAKNLKLTGRKIVLDCANGAAYKVAPKIFKELGAELIILGIEPDGLNINKGCGSTHPEYAKKAVIENKADIGIALDGDADRVIFVDDKGDILDGDEIIALSAIFMKENNRLNHNTVVVTPMSNIGLNEAMKKHDIKVESADVGDRYVIEKMMKIGANFGGENSGHLIFSDHITTGDGVIAALQVLNIMKETGKPLSELRKCMKKQPQILKNVVVKEKLPFEKIPGFNDKIKEVESALGDHGRILVRYSGTENCCRILIEGRDEREIIKYADDLANILKPQVKR